jgi:hypothetical protein
MVTGFFIICLFMLIYYAGKQHFAAINISLILLPLAALL